MSAQRYAAQTAQERMAAGLCPECGKSSREHLDDARFWLPRSCDLLPRGVVERIQQYEQDADATEAAR